MILVIGGAGYIGSHIVKHLTSHGKTCVVLDNLVYGHEKALCTPYFEKNDLLNPQFLHSLFLKYPIQSVMHFAAYTYVGESVLNPQKYYKNNVVGTLNLLETMLEHNVKNIVFSSTCAVYGEPQYLPLDEAHPLNPINPYGQSKLIIENILADYRKAYGLNHISLRYFNAAGASGDSALGESHNPETHLIPLIFQAIKKEIPHIQIFGTDYNTPDGTCIRDYIHVEDLATAHASALEKLPFFSGSLNIGTGKGISVKEIITTAEKITKLPCPLVYSPRREGDPPALFAANNLAKSTLDWTPKHSEIENILSTAWAWEQNRRF